MSTPQHPGWASEPVSGDHDDQGESTSPIYQQPQVLAAVLFGGMAGTFARWQIGQLFASADSGWPWATFTVNLVGCLLLGLLTEGLSRYPDTGGYRLARLIFATGFCGAFTTYSTFAVEIVLLADAGSAITGFVYLLASVLGGLVAAWIGFWMAGLMDANAAQLGSRQGAQRGTKKGQSAQQGTEKIQDHQHGDEKGRTQR